MANSQGQLLAINVITKYKKSTIAYFASYLNQSWMELKKNQCHKALKLFEIIALSEGNSSLIPSEELGLQISYSSSSTAVAISLGINVLLSLLN